MRKLWIGALISILLLGAGCLSPLQKRDQIKRKVERLITVYALDKDTQFSTRIDTFYKRDTISFEEIKSDTQIVWGYKDTIISYTDAGITTRLEFVHDTVRIKTVVHKRDTIVQYKDVVKVVTKTVPISVEPEAPKKACKILWFIPCWYLWLVLVLTLGYFSSKGAIKLYKEWKTR
jgi:hypothetical protein